VIQYDFKPKNIHRKTRKKKAGFPLLRLVLLGALLWGGYSWYNSDKVDVAATPKASEKKNTPVETSAKSPDYNEFTLPDGNRQVSLVLQSSTPDSILDTLSGISLTIAETEQVYTDGRKVLDFVYNSKKELVRFRIHRPDQLLDFSRYFDSSGKVHYLDSTGCAWNKLCLQSPLAHAAIELDSLFDFSGREKLQYYDKFIGLGESPVRASEKGIVISEGLDSTTGLQMMRLYHGQNTEILYKGLAILSSAGKGDTVNQGDVLGRLSPRDSSSFYVQVLRNGKFVRFENLRAEAFPRP